MQRKDALGSCRHCITTNVQVNAQCDKLATELSWQRLALKQRFALKVANFQLPRPHLTYQTCLSASFGVGKLDSLCYRRIAWRCLSDPTFSRFSRTPSCERQTDNDSSALASVARIKLAELRALDNIPERSRPTLIIGGTQIISKQCGTRMSAEYGELRPTNGWDRLASLPLPTNFNGFRVLASLLHQRRSPMANQILHDAWPSPGLVHNIYISGALVPWRNFARCNFTLHPSIALSYIGSVTARHSSSRRQPNFAAWSRNGITELSQTAPPIISLGGHHDGHRPTF